MSIENIIRAWKDEDFRSSLSEAQRNLLPENPAGEIQLSDTDLRGIIGGALLGNAPAPQPMTAKEKINR